MNPGLRNVLVTSLVVWICLPAQLLRAADEATNEEYKERLERYDVENKPEDHKRLASWCKRSYPSKYQFHVTAYNKHVFSQEVARLPTQPTANHYKVLEEKAVKLALPDEAQEYLGKWGEVKYAAFAKRLKPGDVKMMKQLVEWCDKNGIAFIDPAQKLAGEILEQDPEYALSRRLLGHIEWKGEWMSKADAIGSIDIKSVEDRIALHQASAAARASEVVEYPTDPFKGMNSMGTYHEFSPRGSPRAKFLVHESGYSRKKPCRLILALHGGGDGTFSEAENYAGIAMRSWTRQKGDHVVLAPIATKQAAEAWRQRSNVAEILDAMEEICERFNIDRKRIYITGHSMGGAGATTFYNAFPEFAAASCGRAGWFCYIKMQKDLLQKPILIIQGEDDTEKRVDSKEKFLKMAAKCNGGVTYIGLPGVGHDIPEGTAFSNLLPFFDKHTNDIEPDFDVIRAAAKKWMMK